MKKLKSSLTLAAVVMLSVVMFAQCTDAKKKLIQAQVEILNKTLPQTVDHITTLDKVEMAGDGMQYFYTLKTDSKMKYGEFAKKMMKKTLIETLVNNDVTKPLRDAEITMTHTYRDADGKTLMEFVLSPDAYNGPLPEFEPFEEIQGSFEAMEGMLPMQMNAQLSVISAKAEAPSTVKYVYQLSGVKKADITANMDMMKQQSVQEMKANPAVSKFIAANVTLHYTYQDETGELLAEIILAPEDYK